MPINFHPSAGQILICDFSSGFQPPEMVKVRPLVVISPRRRSGQLVKVVPLSSSPPTPIEPWHHKISASVYPPARAEMWAKCDMVITVSINRLDRVKHRDASGKRLYMSRAVPPLELAIIQHAVKATLGLP